MQVEANRIWHEPEVIIYGNLITPGIQPSAQAYDIANRRWYQLNVDSEVWDDEWLSGIVTKHVTEYYRIHASMPPLNVIDTTLEEVPTTFSLKPDNIVGRPLRDRLYYSLDITHAIPTTSFDQLVDKIYLGRTVDRCVWKSRDCVFKRIEFDCDLQAINREIKAREQLMESMHLSIEDSR